MPIFSSHFSSSHFTERVELQFSSNILIIHNLPADSLFNNFMIVLCKGSKTIMQKILCRKKTSRICLNFPLLEDGEYFLGVYYSSAECRSYYEPYLYGNNIIVHVENNIIYFKVPDIAEHNSQFLNNISTDNHSLIKYTKPSYSIQSYDSDIKQKAKEIVKFSHTNYHRLLSIHNWVARNLFYDYDSLTDNAYKKSKISAIDVLRSEKSVCQGYSELTIALIRSLCIPVIGIMCYASNTDTVNGNMSGQNQSEANHIFSAAYIDNRWILMDCTWDSPNRYEKNVFRKINTNGIFTKYFDPTLQFISSSHKFTEIFI